MSPNNGHFWRFPDIEADYFRKIDLYSDFGPFLWNKKKKLALQQMVEDGFWESLENDLPPPQSDPNAVANPELLDVQPILEWLKIRWPNASAAIRRDLAVAARCLIQSKVAKPHLKPTLDNCSEVLPFSQMRSRLCFALLQQMYQPRTGATRADRADTTNIPAICAKVREMQDQSLSDVKTIGHAREWLEKVKCPYQVSRSAEFKARIYLATQCPCCENNGWTVALTAKNLKEHKFRIQCFNEHCKLEKLRTNEYKPRIGSDGLRIFYAMSVGKYRSSETLVI
jgi:hypothetical protein